MREQQCFYSVVGENGQWDSFSKATLFADVNANVRNLH